MTNNLSGEQASSYEVLVDEWKRVVEERGIVVPKTWEEVGLPESFYTPDAPIHMLDSLIETFAAVDVNPADIVDKDIVLVGAAEGYQALLLEKLGAKSVLGIEYFLKENKTIGERTNLVGGRLEGVISALPDASVDIVVAPQFFNETDLSGDPYGKTIFNTSFSKLKDGGMIVVSADADPYPGEVGKEFSNTVSESMPARVTRRIQKISGVKVIE